jgi:hypothetical protein
MKNLPVYPATYSIYIYITKNIFLILLNILHPFSDCNLTRCCNNYVNAKLHQHKNLKLVDFKYLFGSSMTSIGIMARKAVLHTPGVSFLCFIAWSQTCAKNLNELKLNICTPILLKTFASFGNITGTRKREC